MKKYLYTFGKIYIPIFLLMVNISFGLNLCQEVEYPYHQCQIVTPQIYCNVYNYDIINTTSGNLVIDDGTLALVNGQIYNFTFNQSAGNYVIRLCDNTTKEIKVGDEDNMISTSVYFLTILGVVFFLVGITVLLTRKKIEKDEQ